jgi:hypothetical protein
VSVGYQPPGRRGEGPGMLVQDIKFAHLRVEWRNESFIAIVAEWREQWANLRQTSLLRRGGSEAEQIIKALLTAVWAHSNELHDEVWLFNEGCAKLRCMFSGCSRTYFTSHRIWNKDKGLWKEIQKSSWDDVILDEELKGLVQNDVDNFFKSENVYKNLAVPWKRGKRIFLANIETSNGGTN